MNRSLTLDGVNGPRILRFFSGLGMAVASALTIQHFFLARLTLLFNFFPWKENATKWWTKIFTRVPVNWFIMRRLIPVCFQLYTRRSLPTLIKPVLILSGGRNLPKDM